MKNITIAGRLGKDAELRRTQNGTLVLGFSVAVDDRQNKSTMWFSCSLWGKRGESLAQYLTKGTAVTVMGDFSTREHEGKTYLEVNVSDVAMQGGGKAQDTAGGNDFGQDLDDSSSIPF